MSDLSSTQRANELRKQKRARERKRENEQVLKNYKIPVPTEDTGTKKPADVLLPQREEPAPDGLLSKREENSSPRVLTLSNSDDTVKK